MAKTTTEPPAAGAAKIKEVPADVVQRVMRGEAVTAKPDPEKLKKEQEAQAAKEKEEAAAKEKTEKEKTAKEAADKKKLEQKTLPPIPATTAAAAITKEEVRTIVKEERAAPAGGAQTSTFTPEDQTDLDLAQFAARTHADKYADLPKRLTEWIGRRDQFLADKAKELGGRDSADFRDFVRGDEFGRYVRENAPSYQRGDAKRIYEEHLEDRGVQRAKREMQPQLDAVQRKQNALEQAPIIQKNINDGMITMIGGPDPQPDESLVEFAKSPVEFVKSNEVEGSIITRHATFFKEAMEETLKITSGLVDVTKMGQPTPTQAWINQFIMQKDREIETGYPNGVRMPDNKILVSAQQFERLQSSRAPNLSEYRMMAPAEIVGAIAIEGRAEIKRQLSAERDRLARAGYQRVKTIPAIPNGEKSATSSAPASPMAGSAAARGSSSGTQAKEAEPYYMKYITGKGA